MKQLDLLISKFHLYGGKLNTAQFASDPSLACEYRRLLCELRKTPGYVVGKRKVTNHLFEYSLTRITEENSQLRFA